MLLRCLVSFAMVITILAEGPIAPTIKSNSDEVIMIDDDSKLKCSLVWNQRNTRMDARTGIYKIAFNYDAPTIDPIRNKNKIHLDEKASNTFEIENKFENKGYAWCMASFGVFGQVKYFVSTTKIRVLPSSSKPGPKMKLPDKTNITRNQFVAEQIDGYDCAAATGCIFQIRSEKFVNSELVTVKYEDNVAVDPTTGKVYIVQADFAHVKTTDFVLTIVYKPIGTQSILGFLKLGVKYHNDINAKSKPMELLPLEGDAVDKLVYDGQYGVPLVCIPTKKVAVEWYNSTGKLASKNSDLYTFDKSGWVMYINKASQKN